MNAPVTIKGWCPGALRPMMSGDGLLVRVRVRDATLTPANTLALADLSRRFGNGAIDLTRRANLQLRGVREAYLPALTEALRASGLIGAEEDAGQPVNIVTSPLAGLDTTMMFDPRPLAARIEAGLLADTLFRDLPSKFGFAIDGNGVLPLGDTDADIGLQATNDEACIAIRLAGSSQRAIVGGEDAANAALSLTRAFLDLRAGERRMRAVVGRVGAEAVFAAGGLVSLAKGGASADDPCETSAERPLGLIRFADNLALGVAAPFGAWKADDLTVVARIAALSPDATLRVTPLRVLLIAGLSQDALIHALDELAARALIVTPDDPRLAIAACAGAPACQAASVPTRALAQEIAASAGPSNGITVHVSGCAKGCAQPHPVLLTLVGRGGCYDLVVGGRADGAPSISGLALDDMAAEVRRRRLT